MPDTGAPWFIPYVEAADLVSDWPADSLALANAIDAGLDAALLPGIGSNVVQTVKTDTFTTTSTTFTPVTGLSVSITPTSASSKVYIVAQISNASNGASAGGAFRLMRGATPIGIADAAGSRPQATAFASDNNGDVTVISFLDSPATTSSTTYSVDVMVAGQGITTQYVNIKEGNADTADGLNARGVSSITAIEVAA